MYLLDTCFLSEIKKKSPDIGVMQAFEAMHPSQMFISVITIGELQTGIELMQDSSRKDGLSEWLQSLQQNLQDHILPISQVVIEQWAVMNANMRRIGLSVSAFDSLIAATALHHRFHVVTRNVKHFAPTTVEIYNPWNNS